MANKPYVVVVGTDYSEHAERALLAACERVSGTPGAELHVVHAVLAASPEETIPMSPVSGLGVSPVLTLEQQQAALVAYLDERLTGAGRSRVGEARVYAHVLIDTPSLAVTRLASELEADLLVIGSHGVHGAVRWLLGSVAEGVVRRASCPVLVIPPPPEQLVVPAIEPPCPACVAARRASSGAQLWCEQHRERHGRRHTYYQTDRVGSDGSLPLVIREG